MKECSALISSLSFRDGHLAHSWCLPFLWFLRPPSSSFCYHDWFGNTSSSDI
jgi:hypothetical protein